MSSVHHRNLPKLLIVQCHVARRFPENGPRHMDSPQGPECLTRALEALEALEALRACRIVMSDYESCWKRKKINY